MSTSLAQQLNLTPQERRIVVVIAVIVFVVLQLLLVWPHFSDLTKVRAELERTRNTIKAWNGEIIKDVDPANGYRKKLQELQKNQGGGIGVAQIQLQRTVSDQAMRTGVAVNEIRPVTLMGTEKTNAFYEEQSVKITFECEESQLVNFLYNVGNDPAMIRVRELNLHTADANRYKLRGDALLSANYAREPAKAPPPGVAKKAATPPGKAGQPPGAKPATPPTPGGRPPGPAGPRQPPIQRGPPSPQFPMTPKRAPGAPPNL